MARIKSLAHRNGALLLMALMLACALLMGCGAVADSGATCNITAAVTPPSATADHTMLAPGNQVKFSATSSVTGNCPLMPDKVGTWSTSDAANTTISNDPQNAGLATCLGATPAPATISYSGTVRGHTFTPATLSCK